jgi:hypothetical protein
MGCFDDLISIKGNCTDVTPTSGFYLDDIDLYRGEVEKFIQEPYNDVDSFVADKISFATKTVARTIHSQYEQNYLSRTILNGERIGFPTDNLQLKTGSNNLRGIEIELCNYDSFVDFYLSDLSLFIDTSGAVNVFVYDLIQNKLLDTIPVTAVAGNITTVYPHKRYHSDRKRLHLFIGYNSTGINSYYTTVQNGSCYSCKNQNKINNWLSVNGADVPVASTKIESNLTSVDHTSGILLNYSLECNHEDWLCTNARSLAMPILFRTAADIMSYAIMTTERFNSRTNIDVNELKAKRDYYEANYKSHLESIASRMLLPSDRICFICNDRVQVSYRI